MAREARVATPLQRFSIVTASAEPLKAFPLLSRVVEAGDVAETFQS